MKKSQRLFVAIFLVCIPCLARDAAPARAAGADHRGNLVVRFFDMSGGLLTPLRMRHLGLAVYIQTPSGKNYLYDLGSAYPVPRRPGVQDYDTGRDTIAPFLREKKISVIDGVVISHSHGDHHGGGPYLAEKDRKSVV